MRRTLLLPIAALACAALAAGCGDDDDEPARTPTTPAERLRVNATVGADGAPALPAKVKGGVVTLTLANEGRKPADLQLIRVEGDRTAAEVQKVMDQTGQGGKTPAWFIAEGGVGLVEPGKRSQVVQDLPAGTYFGVNSSAGKPRTMKFTVTGKAQRELPDTPATIVARDYEFETTGRFKAGVNRILFENPGAQPHHLVAAPLRPGKTVADVRTALTQEKPSGPFPIDEKQSVATAVIERDRTQVVELDLPKPGKYAVICFISDRQGGPPHAVKGMVGELDVN